MKSTDSAGTRFRRRIAAVIRGLLPLVVSVVVGVHDAGAQADERPVLVLTSYSSTFSTFPFQIEPINAGLRDAGIPYALHSLDTKRYPSGPRREELDAQAEEFIRSAGPISAVLTADDNALRFVLARRQDLFAGVPVVFLGVNDLKLAGSLDTDQLVTGVSEHASMLETLDLMRRFFPRRSIVAISDDTVSGRADLATFEELTAGMEDIEAWSLARITHSELQRRLSASQTEHSYLVLSPYTDLEGTTLEFSDALAGLVSAAPGSPFFHLWRHGLGDGIIGGKIVSHRVQAELATEMLLAILDGASPGSIPEVRESPNVVILDYEVLREFRVPFWRIPVGATLLNAPAILSGSFWRVLLVALAISTPILVFAVLFWQAARRFRALFMNSASVMLLIDPADGRIQSANHAAAVYYGKSRRELESMVVWDINVMEPEEIKRLMAEAREQERDHFEVRHRVADGSIKDVEIYSGPIGDRRQRLYSIVHDVTARKQAERDLKEARENAEEANRVKTQFVANVSHELRTPLNGIMGMASLLSTSDLTSGQRELLDHLTRGAHDLRTIIESLLAFSSVSVKRLEASPEDFDVATAFDHTREYLSAQASRVDVMLRVSLPEDETWVRADRGKINQVLVNLVSNAIKYSAGHGKSVDAAIAVQDHRLMINVADTGPGIPADRLDDIFEPFVRLDDRTTSGVPGLGLGLAITRELVDLLDGKLEVEHTGPAGTRLRVDVPLGDGAKPPDGEGLDDEVHAEVPRGARVLLVEDEAINRLYFSRTLQAAGYAVTEAGTVAQALISAHEQMPDIVLMDVGLPDMDGITGAEKLRELGGEYARMPIIAVTAYATPADRERVLEAGLNGHLSKPVTNDELLETIANAIIARE